MNGKFLAKFFLNNYSKRLLDFYYLQMLRVYVITIYIIQIFLTFKYLVTLRIYLKTNEKLKRQSTSFRLGTKFCIQ